MIGKWKHGDVSIRIAVSTDVHDKTCKDINVLHIIDPEGNALHIKLPTIINHSF